MIKVGIIGYGVSAKTFHEPFIRAVDGMTLTAISSSKPASELPSDITQYATPQEMFADPEIDVVVNTAPNTQHFPLSKEALEAGKHVVLEKPMVNTVADGQELIAVAEAQNRLLSVYHNRRLVSDFRTVKQLLADGRCGNVHAVSIHYDRFRPTVRDRWRENPGPGAGIWYDLGAHLCDQALQLFGAPKSVTGRCIALRPGGKTVDYVHVVLHYPDKEVLLHSSPFSSAPNPAYRIEGDGGTFVKYGEDPQEPRLKSGMTPDQPGFAQEDTSNYGTYYDAEGKPSIIPSLEGGYIDYYRNLGAAIRGEAPLDVQPIEALNVIHLIEVAQQSSDQGKTLPFALLTA